MFRKAPITRRISFSPHDIIVTVAASTVVGRKPNRSLCICTGIFAGLEVSLEVTHYFIPNIYWLPTCKLRMSTNYENY